VSLVFLILNSCRRVWASVVTDCVPGQRFGSGICTACEVGTFQALPAQDSCRSCPLHMTTKSTGANVFTDCVCAAGYHMGENAQICVASCARDDKLVQCAGVLHVSTHVCVFFPCTKQIKCFGSGSQGQLVNPEVGSLADKKYGLYPEQWGSGLPFSDTGEKPVKQVSTFSSNTCVLFEDGTAKCWGKNTNGETGNPVSTNVGLDAANDFGNLPYIDMGHRILQIEIQNAATCALLDNNSIKCWGLNKRLGYVNGGPSPYSTTTPSAAIAIDFGLNLYPVHMFGERHFYQAGQCARLNTGDVKCWFDMNPYNVMGYESKSVPPEYRPISMLPETNFWPVLNSNGKYIMHLAQGYDYPRDHVCYLLDDGTVGCSGNAVTDAGDSIVAPGSPVDFSGYGDVVQLSVGSKHACVRFADKTAICWGRTNKYGELGIDERFLTDYYWDTIGADPNAFKINNRVYVNVHENVREWELQISTPQAERTGDAALPLARTTFLSIFASGWSTCGMLEDRSIKCWGSATNGIAGPKEEHFTEETKHVWKYKDESQEVAIAGYRICRLREMCGAKVPTLDLGGNVGCCSDDTCVAAPTCDEGQYSTSGTCVPCEAGTYSDVAGSSSCQDCPANTYSTTIGATTSSACISCTDSVSPAGTSRESDCICNAGYGRYTPGV
jgi:hypothetical protein